MWSTLNFREKWFISLTVKQSIRTKDPVCPWAVPANLSHSSSCSSTPSSSLRWRITWVVGTGQRETQKPWLMPRFVCSRRWTWQIVHSDDDPRTAVHFLRVAVHRRYQSESNVRLALDLAQIRPDNTASDSLHFRNHRTGGRWHQPGRSVAHLRAAAAGWIFSFD